MCSVGMSTFVWVTKNTLLTASRARLFYQEFSSLDNPSFVAMMHFKTSSQILNFIIYRQRQGTEFWLNLPVFVF